MTPQISELASLSNLGGKTVTNVLIDPQKRKYDQQN